MEDRGKVKIFRFDPSLEERERYDTFGDIPYEGYTVLNILDYIYRVRDTSLAFRGSLCTKGFCGGCAVTVNGKVVMACHTLAEKEMIIEPHLSFKIIKDLVCDWDIGEDARPVKQTVEITIDKSKCNECRDCIKICVLKVFGVVDKRVTAVHPERCMGFTCKICMDTCWRWAIKINNIAGYRMSDYKFRKGGSARKKAY